ncbi:MAG: SUMF1/EgtB/PvdO family nonheme iron enzyme [Planctomycetes bacterium]|nr:SUMF1/EgtB/PvdO family nonheme iron enzyme [Planctomycetota bacterium]
MANDHGRAARIETLVQDYLRGQFDPAVELGAVEPDLRDEVRAQCEEAAFVQQFFDRLPQPLPAAARPDRIGGCELFEVLGSGAMGEVYRARQIDLDRPVAVKLVRTELAHRRDFQARFRQEAHMLAALDHPGIVRILDYGEEQGWGYFIMELVQGRDLAALGAELAAAVAAAPERACDRIARITAELLEILAYAHGRGIAHRDLKPSNVVLDAADHPHLVDFGLAKAMQDDMQEWSVRTTPGLLLGTPAYWSPEVAARNPIERQAPDIWAVGVMLYQLLTGRLPYVGTTQEHLIAHLATPVALDPRRHQAAVPAPLAMVVTKALAPDLGERYGSAQEFAADLRRFLARQPVVAADWRLLAWLGNHLWRRRRLYAGLGAATLALSATAWIGATAAARADANARAADVLALARPETQDVAEVLPLAMKARELLDRGQLGPERASALTALLARCDERARRETEAARRLIAAGAGSPRGAPRDALAAPNPALQLTGLHRASRWALLGGVVADRFGLLEAAFPQLVVEHPTGGGSTPVRIDALEPITGEPLVTVASGTTPLTAALPPGDYRIVVGDASAFAECLRTLGPPGTTLVHPRLRPTGDVLAGMLPIEAGHAVIGQDLETSYIYRTQTVAHGAFAIDRHEVTCGAFWQYCAATGADLPRTWNGSYDPAWQDLPVVGVTAAQATAFAEWSGKRLPTWTEWQVAARGPGGALYPWGDDQAPLAGLPSLGQPPGSPWHAAALPVGSVPADTSWCGARDMLGNVDEWTSTAYVAQFDGMPFPVYPWRLRAGAAWSCRPDRNAALDAVSPGQPEWFGTGFRCAKSINP